MSHILDHELPIAGTAAYSIVAALTAAFVGILGFVSLMKGSGTMSEESSEKQRMTFLYGRQGGNRTSPNVIELEWIENGFVIDKGDPLLYEVELNGEKVLLQAKRYKKSFGEERKNENGSRTFQKKQFIRSGRSGCRNSPSFKKAPLRDMPERPDSPDWDEKSEPVQPRPAPKAKYMARNSLFMRRPIVPVNQHLASKPMPVSPAMENSIRKFKSVAPVGQYSFLNGEAAVPENRSSLFDSSAVEPVSRHSLLNGMAVGRVSESSSFLPTANLTVNHSSFKPVRSEPFGNLSRSKIKEVKTKNPSSIRNHPFSRISLLTSRPASKQDKRVLKPSKEVAPVYMSSAAARRASTDVHKDYSDQYRFAQVSVAGETICEFDIHYWLDNNVELLHAPNCTVEEDGNPHCDEQSDTVHLDLRNVECSSLDVLKRILEKCGKLESLYLENCNCDPLAEYIVRNTELKYLRLKYCKMDFVNWRLIIDSYRVLEEANFGFTQLDEESITYICKHLPTSIKRLNISGTDRTLCDKNLIDLVKSCPNLVELDLNDSRAITLLGIQPLLDLEHLEHLHLSRCFSLRGYDFKPFLTKLKTLNIINLPMIEPVACQTAIVNQSFVSHVAELCVMYPYYRKTTPRLVYENDYSRKSVHPKMFPTYLNDPVDISFQW